VIAVFLVLGLLAGPLYVSRLPEEQLADNVILNAIPFILIFIAIILAFIAVIAVVASMLNNHISARAHKIIETILIVGIVLGVLGMFQPWIFQAYKYGFVLLLISTLCFILWSHVTPRREIVQEELEPELAARGATDNLESSSGD
jgi:hypothetical protein